MKSLILKTPAEVLFFVEVKNGPPPKPFSISEHGYADRVDISIFTLCDFAYAQCPFHQRVLKSAVSWATLSPQRFEDFLAGALNANHCPQGLEFECEDTPHDCIPPLWQCDGEMDCLDGSDEANCTVVPCQANQFSCDRIRCIPVEWRCDGHRDCQDGMDEGPVACHMACPASTHFQCPGGMCIPHHWRCDGHRECRDGADEEGCATATPVLQTCPVTGQFRCRNGRCIPGHFVCDGVRDCDGSEDEEPASCTMDSHGPSPGSATITASTMPSMVCYQWVREVNQKCFLKCFLMDLMNK